MNIFSYFLIVTSLFLFSFIYYSVMMRKTFSKESFVANLCNQKIDSLPKDLQSNSNNSDIEYVDEVDNDTLTNILLSYSRPKSISYSYKARISPSDEMMLQYKFTDWLNDNKKPLTNFTCMKLALISIHKETNDASKNMAIKAETLIHRQSKNQGKHIIIEAEVIDNKFILNNAIVKGIVFQDKVDQSTLPHAYSSSFSPTYGVYSGAKDWSF